jgi:flavin-binding protein dodecin
VAHKDGKSKDSFDDAVRDALKEEIRENKHVTFTVVEQHGEVLPNPGTINFAVRVDVTSP